MFSRLSSCDCGGVGLRLRRDRRLAIGALALGHRARVAQHVVIARHERHASIVLLALHTLGGGLQVQDLFDLLDFGAQLGLKSGLIQSVSLE